MNMWIFVCYFPIAYVCIRTINRVSHGLCHNITSGRCRTFCSVDVPQLLGSQQLRGNETSHTVLKLIRMYVTMVYLFTDLPFH